MNYYAIERTDNSLRHYGVQGQKWGRRNYQNEDGSYTELGRQHYGYGNGYRMRGQNPNYSRTQRLRDRSVYGSRAVRRINRQMNRGNSISGARSEEAGRIARTRERATRNGRTGNIVGTIAGGTVGGALIRTGIERGGTAIAAALYNKGNYDAGSAVLGATSAIGNSACGTLLTNYAGLTIGGSIGRSIGRNATMVVGGYGPKQYR